MLMARLMAWVARVWRSSWAVTCPMPASWDRRLNAVDTRSKQTGVVLEEQPLGTQPGRPAPAAFGWPVTWWRCSRLSERSTARRSDSNTSDRDSSRSKNGTPLRPERWSDMGADALPDGRRARGHLAQRSPQQRDGASRRGCQRRRGGAAWHGHDETIMRAVYSHPGRDALASAGRSLSDVLGGDC
jgi:hypothetical protein